MNVFKDIVQVPSDFTLKVMKYKIRATRKSGKEEGAVVAKDKTTRGNYYTISSL